nr:hypothetical protein CFP56_70481 [Quercus suber]
MITLAEFGDLSSCPFSAISQKTYERKARRRIEVCSIIDKYSSQFARSAMFRLYIMLWKMMISGNAQNDRIAF